MNTLRYAAFAALTVLASLTVACGPSYDRTEFANTKADPLGGGINYSRVELHEGLILTSQIRAWNDDNEQMTLRVRVTEPDFLEIRSTASKDLFAFIGKKPGRTNVEFLADDKVVMIIPAEVLVQPTPP
jgi:hypothetical protein